MSNGASAWQLTAGRDRQFRNTAWKVHVQVVVGYQMLEQTCPSLGYAVKAHQLGVIRQSRRSLTQAPLVTRDLAHHALRRSQRPPSDNISTHATLYCSCIIIIIQDRWRQTPLPRTTCLQAGPHSSSAFPRAFSTVSGNWTLRGAILSSNSQTTWGIGPRLQRRIRGCTDACERP